MGDHRRPSSSLLGSSLSRRSFMAGASAGVATLLPSASRGPAFATQGTAGEITVLYRVDQNDHFKAVIEAFTKETGIGVNYETYPPDYLTGQQLVTTRLAGGDPGLDCFSCDDFQVAIYGAAEWLEPLQPVVEEYGIQLDDYLQPLVTDVSSWNDTLYRLPWDAGFEVFMYRADFFAEAGVDPPRDWEELVQVASALTSAPDRFGIALPAAVGGSLVNDVQHWANQAGGAIDRLDDPGSREAIPFYKDLFATHKVAPSSTPEETYSTALQGFLDDRYAMWWCWFGFLGTLSNEVKFANDQISAFVPLPRGPANAETTIASWGWAINRFSAKKDLAKQWIEFTARPEIMKLQMLRGVPPARSSLWSDPEYLERVPQLALVAQLAKQDNAFRARPISPGIQEISDAVEQNVHAYLTDQVDLDGAIERAMDEIAPIVEEYGEQ